MLPVRGCIRCRVCAPLAPAARTTPRRVRFSPDRPAGAQPGPACHPTLMQVFRGGMTGPGPRGRICPMWRGGAPHAGGRHGRRDPRQPARARCRLAMPPGDAPARAGFVPDLPVGTVSGRPGAKDGDWKQPRADKSAGACQGPSIGCQCAATEKARRRLLAPWRRCGGRHRALAGGPPAWRKQRPDRPREGGGPAGATRAYPSRGSPRPSASAGGGHFHTAVRPRPAAFA